MWDSFYFKPGRNSSDECLFLTYYKYIMLLYGHCPDKFCCENYRFLKKNYNCDSQKSLTFNKTFFLKKLL